MQPESQRMFTRPVYRWAFETCQPAPTDEEKHDAICALRDTSPAMVGDDVHIAAQRLMDEFHDGIEA